MWDPVKYLAFSDHRARPFHDLLGRIAAEAPRRVVDLGCGAGNLTLTLAQRWPSAVIEALDSSPEMVDEARSRGVAAEVGNVAEWTPKPDTDVVVTNAVLQWVPGHDQLLRRWAAALPDGAWLALQVPGNFDGSSHRLVRELAARWELRSVLREDAPVLEPSGYAELLAAAGYQVDAWETTYLQQLTGPDPVLEWVTGTALRPIKAALGDARFEDFRTELAPMLREAYPQSADGTTWFPFRRVFAVAQGRG
jgi:trans-aconitate 2-methyltransferase